MKIQILGSGCAKCKALAQTAEDAVKALGTPYELEKITDMAQIASFGVMKTPALVVDGTIKSVGILPTNDEMQKLLLG